MLSVLFIYFQIPRLESTDSVISVAWLPVAPEEDVLDNIMEEEIKKFGVAKTQTPEEYYNEEIRRARISAMSHCWL